MNSNKTDSLRERYRKILCDDILEFWLRHGLDREQGGYFTCLDRDGSLIDSDKSVWFQGRISWVFSQAYMKIQRKKLYLDAARSGIEFLEKHGFDRKGDGRMYFRLTREGAPLIKRIRYFFSEAFALMAYASYGMATGESKWIEKAEALLKEINHMRGSESPLSSKFDQTVRPASGFAVPMIMINALSQLREANGDNEDYYNALIDEEIHRIHPFLNREYRCVLEQTGPKGEFQDHYEGRLLNPGHAIEGAWFIMKEGLYRNNESYKKLGLTMLDWMWEWGWDMEYGGIIYFKDAMNKPSGEYWHDMKFWWPQNEAVIANLYAWQIRGEKTDWERFEMIDSWAHEHFHDTEYGEWYGYLHRDGTLSSSAKGTLYKGGFHVPRMYMACLELLQ